MLSDQCEHHIVLRAEGKETALDGPLPVQMEECLQRIAKLNPSVKLSNRIAMYKKFPPTAIREALVNSLIHFDASKGDRILVTVGDSLLKVDSPGSVYVPMDQDSPFVRNALMGEFLVNAGYANLKGRGLQTMKTSYRTSGMLPSISRSNGHFVVNLPSLT
jgi:predicted HTH transcriptional regulator